MQGTYLAIWDVLYLLSGLVLLVTHILNMHVGKTSAHEHTYVLDYCTTLSLGDHIKVISQIKNLSVIIGETS